APGDAVERKWLVLEEPATPWGGYIRRFYFRSTSPIIHSDLMVVVPKDAEVWTHSYNGAPLPTKQTSGDRVVYYWRLSDVESIDPEPHAVPYEEYVPFVVVAVNADRTLAERTNVLGIPEAAPISSDIRRKAEALISGVDRPEER